MRPAHGRQRACHVSGSAGKARRATRGFTTETKDNITMGLLDKATRMERMAPQELRQQVRQELEAMQ